MKKMAWDYYHLDIPHLLDRIIDGYVEEAVRLSSTCMISKKIRTNAFCLLVKKL